MHQYIASLLCSITKNTVPTLMDCSLLDLSNQTKFLEESTSSTYTSSQGGR